MSDTREILREQLERATTIVAVLQASNWIFQGAESCERSSYKTILFLELELFKDLSLSIALVSSIFSK